MNQNTNSQTTATRPTTSATLRPMSLDPANLDPAEALADIATTNAAIDTTAVEDAATVSQTAPWVIAALYQFRALENAAEIREHLLARAEAWGLCGTLIVAPEGINGTVAGSRKNITALHNELLRLGFDDMEYKES